MTGGQAVNATASAIVATTSLTFIIVWTIVGRWYKTSVGRFMVMKASAICLTGGLTVWLTLTGFNWDALRYVQASLWLAVSGAFVHHTMMVYRINRKEHHD